MKLVLYVNQRKIPLCLPDWLLLNTVTQNLLKHLLGFDILGLSFSKEQFKALRHTMKQMRHIHGSLCLFDLDDGVGKEFGEKFQLYL